MSVVAGSDPCHAAPALTRQVVMQIVNGGIQAGGNIFAGNFSLCQELNKLKRLAECAYLDLAQELHLLNMILGRECQLQTGME
jgi:hypothetical protein